MAATKTKAAKKPTKDSASANGACSEAAPTDVLTLAEAAAYLRVTEDDVVNMVHTQDLAGRQVGNQWRFLKSSIQEWLGQPTRKFNKESFLALSGVWRGDPYAEEMLKDIYARRRQTVSEEGK
jgi:excisionase family DNA binding protein